jgi:hypothetical protein
MLYDRFATRARERPDVAIHRECTKCKLWLRESSFNKSGFTKFRKQRRRARCFACEQIARDTKKRANRFVSKAEWTFEYHSLKFRAQGILKTRNELRTKYGWVIGKMAWDAGEAYANRCVSCSGSFKGMGNGLHSLTLEVIDRSRPPHYGANTRWACASCNVSNYQQWLTQQRAVLSVCAHTDNRAADQLDLFA